MIGQLKIAHILSIANKIKDQNLELHFVRLVGPNGHNMVKALYFWNSSKRFSYGGDVCSSTLFCIQ
jgi:hypothetical protein